MSDQKNPANAGHTTAQNQKPGQASNKGSKPTPQDSDRVGGDASRTEAKKPEARTTEQPGRTTKPDIEARKK